MSSRIQDAIINPRDQLHIIVLPADDQQLIKEEAPDEWRPGVDQKDPEPLHIKEEQEELWTSLCREQLDVKEETDVTKYSFTAVLVKSEDDEEKPLFSQLHQHQMDDGDLPTRGSADQMTSVTDGGDCGGAETTRISDLNTHDDNSNSSETDVSEDDEDGSNSGFQLKHLSDSVSSYKNSDWKESRALESGVNTVSKSFRYSECGQQFANWSNQEPMTSCSKIRTSNCFAHKKCFEVEKKIEKSFSCDDCGKRFTRKADLNIHVRIHTGLKPFGCDVCERRFSVKSSLNKHTRIHTGQKPFVCDACGQSFSDISNLNGHMRIHTGQKPFGCDVCEQKFTEKNTLNRHMRIHTGQKPFSCDDCGQKFTLKSSLNTHMRIHTGLKPFGCDDCGQRFSQKTSLNRHKRIHTGQKPFNCNVCERRFSDKKNLNRHMIIHTRQKPFGCDVCERRFSDKRSLNSHMRIHTGQKRM